MAGPTIHRKSPDGAFLPCFCWTSEPGEDAAAALETAVSLEAQSEGEGAETRFMLAQLQLYSLNDPKAALGHYQAA